MIDDTDTYIVRDVLTDDLIFVTPEDVLNNGNGYDTSYDNYVNLKKKHLFSKTIVFFYYQFDIETARDSLSMSLINTDGDYQLVNQFTKIMLIEDDDELESEIEYEK